jgi:hypothetical protein
MPSTKHFNFFQIGFNDIHHSKIDELFQKDKASMDYPHPLIPFLHPLHGNHHGDQCNDAQG